MTPPIFKATCLCLWMIALPLSSQQPVDNRHFEPLDVFALEYSSDPRISPDGAKVVYVRNFMDIMKDRVRSNL